MDTETKPRSLRLAAALLVLLGVTSTATAQPVTMSGRLSMAWADSREDGPTDFSLYLSSDDGTTSRLRLGPNAQIAYPQLMQLNGEIVTVTGSRTQSLTIGQPAQTDIVVDGVRAAGPVPSKLASGPLLSGPQPWVTLLCRFADVPATPHPAAYYQQFLSATGPSTLDDYWREVSYDNINLTGSAVAGEWMTLPQPKSYYVRDTNGDGTTELDLSRAANDCTNVWDSTVNFANFVGVNMLFNDTFGDQDASLGGSTTTLTRDGVTKSWRATWMPIWGDYPSIYCHEMGHGFGFPHSSGPYGQIYDSKWDVMSFVQGEHTISYHMDLDGWIPASRILQMNGAGSSVITLDRLAQPTTGTNYLMAKIPIKGSLQHFYTVEARRQVGYDITIPGNAVIIHEVLTTRTEPAHVVDVDNNGNPNDAGAMWNAGETFNDPANGVTVSVVSETATTSTVVITLSGAASELTVFGTLAGTAGPPDVTDGTGSAARFNTPFGLAADASGNLFVADEFNHTIRKISRAGVVTTFVGQAGTCALADGTGTAARLCYPAGLAIDGGGMLYVADAATVRKVTPAGVVTTIAGGPANGSQDGTGSAARFNFPTGLAVDSTGILYVADTDSHTIRKITAGGVVTTFAGAAGVSGSADGPGSAARFNSPRGLAVDSTGLLYVADQGNRTIRTITPAGVVTTLAGSALSGGLVDGAGSSARLLSPYGVAIDRSGNIDIADYRAVRRLTPAGVVTTLAGSNGSGGAANGAGDAVSFTFLGGIAVDAVGTIYAADGGNNTIRASLSSNQLTLTPVALKFGGTANASGALTSVTPAQTIAVAITSGTAWTATADQPWVAVTGGSQTGSGTFQVAIVNPGNVLAGVSNVTATITFSAPSLNVTKTVSVWLSILPTSATSVLPVGLVDTPANGSVGVTGSIAVTGWAMDDEGVASVKIYRNCLSIDNPASCQNLGGNSLVLIGDAAFIAGARPDVEALYPSYPFAYRAGWGYLLLTNMLPHVTAPPNPGGGGQGPLTLFVYATDVEGHTVLLGQKSITLDNDHGVKPFGGIDTPAQGGTASGQALNFGWALTPSTAMIPADGSTMTVIVDGVAVGNVDYNHCRAGASPTPPPGTCADDIATLFPTLSNITAGSGAIGVFSLDTTTLTNGLHTIVWAVTDNQGRADGIGSRFFNVLNGGSSLTAGLRTATSTASSESSLQTALAAPVSSLGSAVELAWRSVGDADIDGRAGFDFGAPLETIHADSAGVRHVRMPELGRVELRVGRDTTAGYLSANGTLRPLPAGSQLDTATGVFTWAPGPGFIGTYDLVFLQAATQLAVAVTIEPKPSEAAGQMRGWIDLPTARATVGGTFTVAGWALDSAAWQGSGVGAVHVWAQRRDVPASQEIFLGVATIGGARPDVAGVYGPQFDRSGWSVTASGVEPGTYDVTAYFWSTRTGRFEDGRTVTVRVR